MYCVCNVAAVCPVTDESGSEPDAAILEEQEALAIQKKMAAQLDDADIGLDMFKVSLMVSYSIYCIM